MFSSSTSSFSSSTPSFSSSTPSTTTSISSASSDTPCIFLILFSVEVTRELTTLTFFPIPSGCCLNVSMMTTAVAKFKAVFACFEMATICSYIGLYVLYNEVSLSISALYCFADASNFDITASICSRAPCAPAMESFFDHSYAFIAHTIAELPASIAWSLFRGVILPWYTSVAFCVTLCVTLLKNVGSLGKSFSFALHELSMSASSHVSNSFNLALICAIDSALGIVPASNNTEYKYCSLSGIKMEND